MNAKQTVVMWVAVIAIVLMALVPPWCGYPAWPTTGAKRCTAGYHLLFSPPARGTMRGLECYVDVSGIDLQRLFSQIAVAVLVSGTVIYSLRTKPKPGDEVIFPPT